VGRPGIATLLHLVSWLLAVSVSAQPVFAGLFLDGHDAWRDWHAGNGMLLLPLLALTQLVLAVLAWRTGRGPGWLPSPAWPCSWPSSPRTSAERRGYRLAGLLSSLPH
jgi:hypothetical protein